MISPLLHPRAFHHSTFNLDISLRMNSLKMYLAMLNIHR